MSSIKNEEFCTKIILSFFGESSLFSNFTSEDDLIHQKYEEKSYYDRWCLKWAEQGCYNFLPHGDVGNLWIFHSSRYTYTIFSSATKRWERTVCTRLLNEMRENNGLEDVEHILHSCRTQFVSYNTSYKLTIFLSRFPMMHNEQQTTKQKIATLTLISILDFFPHCRNTQKWYSKLRFCFYRCCSSSSTSHFLPSLRSA
jgi:hypothetical protein